MGLQVALTTDAARRQAAFAVPLAFGVASLWMGQDGNWDLFNYHLYNAFAFLNGKIGVDFAPAGTQSYFDPLLDVPYYWATRHLPPAIVQFAMGMLHGLNFVIVLGIARRLFAAFPEPRRNAAAVLTALAGVLTANFLSELGTTMGDDTTSLFVLGSLLLIVKRWDRIVADRKALVALVGAGVLMGLGTGLKLTNAVYAIATCIGVVTLPAAFRQRMGAAIAFALGVIAGVGVTAGFWFYRMANEFGNPLFPMFGALFPNPLAAAGAGRDTRWLPQGIGEALLWPFVISLDAQRIGEQPLRQIIWALLYAAFLAWAAVAIVRKARKRPAPKMDSAARFVVVVVASGFIAWMAIFSIGRYLVPIELLAPLVLCVVLAQWLPEARARTAGALAVGVATVVVVAGGAPTGAHMGRGSEGFAIDAPAIAQPARTTVILVGEDPPMAWLATAFPREVAFTQVGGNFPEGPAFRPHIREMVARRGGAVFAIVAGHYDSEPDRGKLARVLADAWGITHRESTCDELRDLSERWRLRMKVRRIDAPTAEERCTLDFARRAPRDIATENRVAREKAQAMLAAYGFVFTGEPCSYRVARIGDSIRAFQWCPIRRDSP